MPCVCVCAYTCVLLHGVDVLLEQDVLARLALLGREDFDLLEHGDVLRRHEALHRIDAGRNDEEPTLLRLGGPRVIVAVAVEDRLHVLLQHRLRRLDAVRAALDGVGELLELGGDG